MLFHQTAVLWSHQCYNSIYWCRDSWWAPFVLCCFSPRRNSNVRHTWTAYDQISTRSLYSAEWQLAESFKCRNIHTQRYAVWQNGAAEDGRRPYDKGINTRCFWDFKSGLHISCGATGKRKASRNPRGPTFSIFGRSNCSELGHLELVGFPQRAF